MLCSVCGKEGGEEQLYCGYCGQLLSDTPEAEKKCRICGEVMPEDHPFCTKCGSMFQIPAAIPAPTPTPAPEKPRKKRRRGLRLFLFLLLLALLAFIFYGGFYIGQNGWDSVPFADRLTFLPFMQESFPVAKNKDSDYDGGNNYADQGGDDNDGKSFQSDEEPHRGDSLEATPDSREADKKVDEPPAPTDSPPINEPDATAVPPVETVTLAGDWKYEDEAHFYLIRFGEKNRYLMVTVEWEGDKAYSRFSAGTYTEPDPTLDNAFQLSDETSHPVFDALAGAETIEIDLTGEEHYIFEPHTAVPTAFGGLWAVIDGEDYYMYFSPDGACILGAGLDAENTIQYIDTEIAYRYDEPTRHLEIFDPADSTNFEAYQVDVFKDLAVLVGINQPMTVVMRKVSD